MMMGDPAYYDALSMGMSEGSHEKQDATQHMLSYGMLEVGKAVVSRVLLDSGASFHATPSPRLLEGHERHMSKETQATGANKHTPSQVQYECRQFPMLFAATEDGDPRQHGVLLSAIKFMPDLPCTVLSTGQLWDDLGWRVRGEDEMKVILPNTAMVLPLTRVGRMLTVGLFVPHPMEGELFNGALQLAIQTSSDSKKVFLWHSRLALSVEQLHELPKSTTGTRLPDKVNGKLADLIKVCDVRARGATVRMPYFETPAKDRASTVGGRVCIDAWGTYKTAAIGVHPPSHHLFGVTDEFSSYGMSSIIASQSSATFLSETRRFEMTLFKAGHRGGIAILRSDCAAALKSAEMEQGCDARGWVHEWSVEYEKESVGLQERSWGMSLPKARMMILRAAKALMLSKNATESFFLHAMVHARDVYNCHVSKGKSYTRYAIVHGRPPNMDSYRCFMARGHCRLDHKVRDLKSGEVSVPCVFVGIGELGFKVISGDGAAARLHVVTQAHFYEESFLYKGLVTSAMVDVSTQTAGSVTVTEDAGVEDESGDEKEPPLAPAVRRSGRDVRTTAAYDPAADGRSDVAIRRTKEPPKPAPKKQQEELVIVPPKVYNNFYACDENNGLGWTAAVTSTRTVQGEAQVHIKWVHAGWQPQWLKKEEVLAHPHGDTPGEQTTMESVTFTDVVKEGTAPRRSARNMMILFGPAGTESASAKSLMMTYMHVETSLITEAAMVVTDVPQQLVHDSGFMLNVNAMSMSDLPLNVRGKAVALKDKNGNTYYRVEPKNAAAAEKLPEAGHWEVLTHEHIVNLVDDATLSWVGISAADGHKIYPSQIEYKIKVNDKDGTWDKDKARLCINTKNGWEGAESVFFETLRSTDIKVMVASTVFFKSHRLLKIDIKNAHPKAEGPTVYFYPPYKQGRRDHHGERQILRTNNVGFFGVPTATRGFGMLLKDKLIDTGYARCRTARAMYRMPGTSPKEGDRSIAGTIADDILVSGPEYLLQRTLDSLMSAFGKEELTFRWLEPGKNEDYAGLQLRISPEYDRITIAVPTKVLALLDLLGISEDDCKNARKSDTMVTQKDLEAMRLDRPENNGKMKPEQKLLQKAIGINQWIIEYRTDIHAFQWHMSRVMAYPDTETVGKVMHAAALRLGKKVYAGTTFGGELKGNQQLLQMHADDGKRRPKAGPRVYKMADPAPRVYEQTHDSTWAVAANASVGTDAATFMGGCIDAKVYAVPGTPLSSIESEMYSKSVTICRGKGHKAVLTEIDMPQDSKTMIWGDNATVVGLANEDKASGKVRHFARRIAFVQDECDEKDGTFASAHCRSEENVANALGKMVTYAELEASNNYLMNSANEVPPFG